MSTKFFLITLEKRRKLSEENAALINEYLGEAVIVPGYNPSSIKESEFLDYSQKFISRYDVSPLLNQLACLRAHVQAMTAFLETEDEYCVIGEDDFTFQRDDLIRQALARYTPNSGLLINFGGFQGLPVEKMRVMDKEGFVPTSKLRLIHMMALYCVDRSFACQYVRHAEELGLNNDDWKGLHAEGFYKVLKLQPSIYHGDETSILDPRSSRGYENSLLGLKIFLHNLLSRQLSVPVVPK